MFRDFYKDAEILHGLVSRLQGVWIRFDPVWHGDGLIESKYRIDGKMVTISIWNPGGGEDTVYEYVDGRCRVK